MRIRAAAGSDYEQLIRIFTSSVHGLTSEHYDDEQRAAWAPSAPDERAWRERLERLWTWVAEDEKEILGFISHDLSGHIDLLYVARGAARRGVATALWREVEVLLAFEGATEATTEASSVARPFFERQGFVVVDEQTVIRSGLPLRRFVMKKSIAVDAAER